MSTPKITVIIPIYNTEKYLDKCIRSVREQTFNDIEIICVDDCSPDESRVIVEKHMREDERIIFLQHEKNLGLGGARNSAIRIARGEYIASVDSDDYMQPKMLEKLWAATDNGLFDIVSCGFNHVDEMGSILSSTKHKNAQFSKDEINIFKTLPPAFWNKLWRTSLYTDNQIFFPNHDYYEDMSTTPRILSKANSIKVINDKLYNYLYRSESITGSYGDKYVIDYFKGFEIILEFLIETDLYEEYEEDYNEYVKNNIAYHAKNVLGSDLYLEKKKQYLRNLLFLKLGFQENYKAIRYRDLNDLVNFIKDDSPSFYFNRFQAISREKQNIELKNMSLGEHAEKLETKLVKLEKDKQVLLQQNRELVMQESVLEAKLSEVLSTKEAIFVSLFGLVAKYTMSKKQYIKLHETPRKFFADSSNKLVRKIAGGIGIIKP